VLPKNLEGYYKSNKRDTMESNKQKYILGFSKRNNNMIKELIAKDIKSNKNQFAKIIKKGNRKYSLRLDNNTRKERLETLENIEENISGKLNKLKAKFEKYAPENVRIELSESKVELTED